MTAVDSLRSRFSEDASASDVVAACARLLGGGEDAVEFLVSVVAREDNPCWLPQEAFEDVCDLVAGCKRRAVGHFVAAAAAAASTKRWAPYPVAHC
jgi:hypothetical protein